MTEDIVQQKFGQTLDDKLISEILNIGVFRSFVKDDIIIDIDQTITFIPLLLSGTIKILREDDEGNDLLIYFLEAGETCTMSLTCCMGTSKSKIRAVAQQDSSLIMIPVQKMQEWLHSNESWRNFILESYQVRFDEMLDVIDSIAFLRMDERLYKYLVNKTILNNSNTILIKHQEIAVDLHTSRVVISRLLKQLEKSNKIVLGRNKIEVLKT